MKKKSMCFTLTVLICLFSFSSCSGQEPAGDFFTENGSFGNSGLNEGVRFGTEAVTFQVEIMRAGVLRTQEREGTRLYRYNLKDCTKTPACIDPLCTHGYGSGCPFFGEANIDLTPVCVLGNRLIYARSDISSHRLNVLHMYDLNTGTDSELFGFNDTAEGISGNIFQYGGIVVRGDKLYSVIFDLKNNAKSRSDVVYRVSEYDSERNETRVLFETEKFTRIYAASNERLFFAEYSGKYEDIISRFDEQTPVRFSTDKKGKNRKEETKFIFRPMFEIGTKAYGTAVRGDGGTDVTVYDISTDELTSFNIGAAAQGMIFTDGKKLIRAVSNSDELSAGYDWKALEAQYQGPDKKLELAAAKEKAYNTEILPRVEVKIVVSDLDGGGEEVRAVIYSSKVAPDYYFDGCLYATVNAYDPETGTLVPDRSGLKKINIGTGVIEDVVFTERSVGS